MLTYLKKTVIDFLSVDVEGADLEALKSNDWKKYQPRIVVVESLDFIPDKAHSYPLYTYLTKKGYRLVANTKVNLIFAHKNFVVTKEIASTGDWTSSQ